jgi:multicomponent Na+:H+ antiporter subunit E
MKTVTQAISLQVGNLRYIFEGVTVMRHVRTVAALLLLYVAMAPVWSWSHVGVGLILATGIILLIRPRRDPITWRGIPTMLIGLIHYTLVLAWEIFLNGLRVAYIVLTPGMDLKPGIIAVPSACQTDLCLALSALVITASPGEIVVEISEEGTLYTHFLEATVTDEEVAEAQRRRRAMLERIFA